MPVITPADPRSQRLEAESCPEIESAAAVIDDPEIVAWLQRHYAARTNRLSPILRPYAKDAIARFRGGLLHATKGNPALILADGRAFGAQHGVITDQIDGVDFKAEAREFRRFRPGVAAAWLGLIAMYAYAFLR